MEIKVLGPGCPRCDQTEDNVRQALRESGLEARVEKVKGAMEIARHGVLTTPAVVIDGEVKCVGKVPDKEEIMSWFKQ